MADGFEVPGWVFVELNRHAEGPWSLEPAEAATLGPLLTQVSQAVRSVTGAERVYWMAYGELMPHFHVLVAPRLP
ncbi:MAG TPA: HIT family protein, partial [Acidimicrobiia bacterium]|nr:HIT family protein [Acidimicrobiia bacterium]